jgi:hypothetical protein
MSNLEYDGVYPRKGESVVTVGDWLIVMVLMCIPLVNLVMPFVWAFGGGDIPQSKRNWARAMLIWAVIMILLYVVMILIFGSLWWMPSPNYGI